MQPWWCHYTFTVYSQGSDISKKSDYTLNCILCIRPIHSKWTCTHKHNGGLPVNGACGAVGGLGALIEGTSAVNGRGKHFFFTIPTKLHYLMARHWLKGMYMWHIHYQSITNLLHCHCQELEGVEMFGVVEGGDILEERARSARETAKRPVAGFCLDGLQTGYMAQALRTQLIIAVTKELPEDKPRSVCSLPCDKCMYWI